MVFPLLASFMCLLAAPLQLSAQDWLPRAFSFRLYPFERVPGMYYFTDRGNYGQNPPRFDEAFTDGPAVDFDRRLALTFDDVHFGPALDRLLDILRDQQVPAVFFLTENHMAGSDDATIRRQLRRMIAEGQVIGNHSAYHPDLDAPLFARGSLAPTREAFARLQARLDRLLGEHYPVKYLRPPFGVRGNGGRGIGDRMSLPGRLDELCRLTGQFIILWQINSLDFLMFENPASARYLDSAAVIAACVSRILASRGGVVLFHANARTPELVGGVLRGLAAASPMAGGGKSTEWQYVTVAELLEIKYGRPWLDAWAKSHPLN